MAIHQVTAVFATRAEAERVARILVSELNIPYAAVDVGPLGHEPPTSYDTSNLWDTAATGPAGSPFMTEESRQAYLDELRRGRMQLSALVDESEVARATHLLDHSGALALYGDERELKHEPQSHQQGSDAAASSSTAAPDSPVLALQAVPPRRSRVRSYPAR